MKSTVVLSEAILFGEDRGLWMEQSTGDCIDALQSGVNLRGICLYPVIDRPDRGERSLDSLRDMGYHK